MNKEERLKLENELLLTKSKARMINMYLDALSIIKEVREYIDSKEYVRYGIIEVDEMKIRKILDKEKE